MWGSVLFHVGVLFVLFGHIFGLLVPIWVFDSLAVKHEWKQALAVYGGGTDGLFSFIGASMLLHRRLFDARVRANSRFSTEERCGGEERVCTWRSEGAQVT